MADLKKFLDQGGVSTLWSRVAEEITKVDDKVVKNAADIAENGMMLSGGGANIYNLDTLIEKLSNGIEMEFEIKRMDPLFATEADYEAFTIRHNKHKVVKADLATYSGNCYMGIDAGSTTTKVAE